jgi:hypothetical protein
LVRARGITVTTVEVITEDVGIGADVVDAVITADEATTVAVVTTADVDMTATVEDLRGAFLVEAMAEVMVADSTAMLGADTEAAVVASTAAVAEDSTAAVADTQVEATAVVIGNRWTETN